MSTENKKAKRSKFCYVISRRVSETKRSPGRFRRVDPCITGLTKYETFDECQAAINATTLNP